MKRVRASGGMSEWVLVFTSASALSSSVRMYCCCCSTARVLFSGGFSSARRALPRWSARAGVHAYWSSGRRATCENGHTRRDNRLHVNQLIEAIVYNGLGKPKTRPLPNLWTLTLPVSVCKDSSLVLAGVRVEFSGAIYQYFLDILCYLCIIMRSYLMCV